MRFSAHGITEFHALLYSNTTRLLHLVTHFFFMSAKLTYVRFSSRVIVIIKCHVILGTRAQYKEVTASSDFYFMGAKCT